LKSHPTLRAGPVLLAVAVIAGLTGWAVYQQHKDERAVQRFHALERRLAAQAKPIHAIPGSGPQLYTCTTKTGWPYTAPTRADLVGLCGDGG